MFRYLITTSSRCAATGVITGAIYGSDMPMAHPPNAIQRPYHNNLTNEQELWLQQCDSMTTYCRQVTKIATLFGQSGFFDSMSTIGKITLQSAASVQHWKKIHK